MLNLNLLPYQEQKNLRYELYIKAVWFFGFWLSMLGFIFLILAVPAYFFSVLQLADVERSRDAEAASLKTSGASSIENEINIFSERLKLIVKRENTRYSAADFISEIFSRAPVGVVVMMVNLDAKRQEAVISGIAKERGALLRFVDALKDSADVKSVSSPVANIIKEEDITFSLSLRTKL